MLGLLATPDLAAAPVWHRQRRVATPSLLAAILAPSALSSPLHASRAASTAADSGLLGWLQVGMETLATSLRHSLLAASAASSRTLSTGIERATSDAELRSLLALAAARPDLAWPEGRDISAARAAHATNAPEELAAALAGEHDFLEGDVRIDAHGRVVMSHNPGAPRILTLDEWLVVGLRSGRGLKLDFKDAAAIVPAVHRAARMGVPSHRFLVNVTVQGERGSVVSLDQLREVRRVYPDVLVNISVCAGRYDERTLERMARWARAAKGPTMFPLRHDLVTHEVVRRVRPFGRVAIWNEPALSSPACIERASRRLRAMGVDGMIDLRPGARVERVARPLVRVLTRTFGWEVAVGVRRLGSQVRELARRRKARTA